jgi:hypothetical protein
MPVIMRSKAHLQACAWGPRRRRRRLQRLRAERLDGALAALRLPRRRGRRRCGAGQQRSHSRRRRRRFSRPWSRSRTQACSVGSFHTASLRVHRMSSSMVFHNPPHCMERRSWKVKHVPFRHMLVQQHAEYHYIHTPAGHSNISMLLMSLQSACLERSTPADGTGALPLVSAGAGWPPDSRAAALSRRSPRSGRPGASSAGAAGSAFTRALQHSSVRDQAAVKMMDALRPGPSILAISIYRRNSQHSRHRKAAS